MMFADDISLLCTGNDVDMTGMRIWIRGEKIATRERAMRVSSPKIQFMDFTFEHSEQGNREPLNILGEDS